MKERPVLFVGEAVADSRGVVGEGNDGCVLVDVAPMERSELPRLLAAGRAVREHALANGAKLVESPGAVLIPGLVNAHTHLDLTHIGPQPHDHLEGFVKWVDMVRARRELEPARIAASVRLGVELSRKGGVVAVGDIGGAAGGRPTAQPWRVLNETGMLGVSFVEFFAIGKALERGRQGAREAIAREIETARTARTELEAGKRRALLGLQPHAPNTVGLEGYRWAVKCAREHGLLLSTHLAETIEEREFIGRAAGSQRDLLERLGIWDDALLGEIGQGRHPVEHLSSVLREWKFVTAHVNDADDASIATLARTGTTVAYCPRGSAYFGAETQFGPHRYQEMMAAGIRVALGTDSIVNLDTPERISVLDEMRFLHRRDGVEPRTLLAMATVNGAAALGLPTSWFELRESGGRLAGLVAVGDVGSGRCHNPWERLMDTGADPRLLLG